MTARRKPRTTPSMQPWISSVKSRWSTRSSGKPVTHFRYSLLTAQSFRSGCCLAHWNTRQSTQGRNGSIAPVSKRGFKQDDHFPRLFSNLAFLYQSGVPYLGPDCHYGLNRLIDFPCVGCKVLHQFSKVFDSLLFDNPLIRPDLRNMGRHGVYGGF